MINFSGKIISGISSDFIRSALHFVYEFFVVISVIVMLLGLLDTMYKIVFKRKEMRISEAIRDGFDKSVLFGLQLLIVADIIETIIAPDLQTIGQVFVVVIIRTILSFSLNYEMRNHH